MNGVVEGTTRGKKNPNHGTVEVWLQEHATADMRDRQQTALYRLSQLEVKGTIAELSINTWAKYINTAVDESSANNGRPALDKAHEFEHWSEQHGASVPGFKHHTQSSASTNTTQEVFITPVLSLAIYVNTDLQTVVPNSAVEEHRTVTAYLDALAATNDSDQ